MTDSRIAGPGPLYAPIALLFIAASCTVAPIECLQSDPGCNILAASIGYQPRAKTRAVFLATAQGGNLSISEGGASNWQTSQPLGAFDLVDSAYGNGYFCVVGGVGSTLRSRDGRAWEVNPTGSAQTSKSVVFFQGFFYAANGTGAAPAVLRSADCASWQLIPTGAGSTILEGLAAGPPGILGCGGDGTINCSFSPDGLSWQSVTPAGITHVKRGVYHKGSFVFSSFAPGGNLVRTVDNGSSWEILPVPGASADSLFGVESGSAGVLIATLAGGPGYWLQNGSSVSKIPHSAGLLDVRLTYGMVVAATNTGIAAGAVGESLQPVLSNAAVYTSVRLFEVPE